MMKIILLSFALIFSIQCFNNAKAQNSPHDKVSSIEKMVSIAPAIPVKKVSLLEYGQKRHHRDSRGPFVFNAYNIWFHPDPDKKNTIGNESFDEKFFVNGLELSQANFLKLDLRQNDVGNAFNNRNYSATYHYIKNGNRLVRNYEIALNKQVFIINNQKIKKKNVQSAFNNIASERIISIERSGKYIMINTNKI